MLSEEKWKKVDKLEDYVTGVTEGKFRIGNKAWRNMEKFVGAFLACGGEETGRAGQRHGFQIAAFRPSPSV